jgi:hypothetical protein
MFRAIAQADAALTDEERAIVVRYLRGAIAAAEAVTLEDAQLPTTDSSGNTVSPRP